MRKFKLLALALVIGTAALFARNVNVTDEREIDEEYEAEILHDEAYGDADFYKKLQQENEAHLGDIIYRSNNLSTATIADDNQGLEAINTLLNDNYKNYLEDDSLIDDSSINDKQSDQCINLWAGVETLDERDKLCSNTLKITER